MTEEEIQRQLIARIETRSGVKGSDLMDEYIWETRKKNVRQSTIRAALMRLLSSGRVRQCEDWSLQVVR